MWWKESTQVSNTYSRFATNVMNVNSVAEKQRVVIPPWFDLITCTQKVALRFPDGSKGPLSVFTPRKVCEVLRSHEGCSNIAEEK